MAPVAVRQGFCSGLFQEKKGGGVVVEYKTADSILDFQFDWSTWLASGDTISTSTWTLESGITEDSESETTTTTTITISGGTTGKTYKATNAIVTANGFEANRTFFLKIQDRLA